MPANMYNECMFQISLAAYKWSFDEKCRSVEEAEYWWVRVKEYIYGH
jgi:hypothetical protein